MPIVNSEGGQDQRSCAYGSTTPSRSVTQSSNPPKPQTVTRKSQDPFLGLPVEVRFIIIEFLQDDIQAVAKLRLSSRAFKQLPQFFYRTLILKLMPWVWEVRDLIAGKQTVDFQKLWRELCRVDGFLNNPIEREGWSADEEMKYFFNFDREKKRWRVCEDVYKDTSAKPGSELWKKAENNYVRADEVTILGLRNRSRVWLSCESLLNTVDDMDDGKIGNRFMHVPPELDPDEWRLDTEEESPG